jgi:Papain-like cysteine protease AvrRpt2
MEYLRRNSKGYKVRLLQRLLNTAFATEAGLSSNKRAPLELDGSFGGLTSDTLVAYKTRKKLYPNDAVAGIRTWTELGIVFEKEHDLKLYGQPDAMTCWSAAATMILGDRSIGPNGAALAANNGMIPSKENIEVFAKSLGWRMLNHSPSMIELIQLVLRKPIWIVISGSGFLHAVVLSGVYSDGDAKGAGTMFRIHDPWPPKIGNIYGSFADPISDETAGFRSPVSLDTVVVPN